MNVEIKVITNAKKRAIMAAGPGLKVKLVSLPKDGRANEELIEYLSEIFHARKSDIKIIRGEKERKKVLAIPVDDVTFRALLNEKVKVTTG
ncbi:MAG: hypothetical protein C0399_07760 [Syntrophus sp. (in: bacteria)]|nr:hypothetical protein [Syntrophus sp. (in: bacteria)]